ncbi:MAG: hypothetical protein IJ416_01270 [Ruminiclostridium sp.]|nr:hypothetical protein [Ruminiclostridium sp.]
MKELLNTGVNLPLVYDESTDALIGQVKGYSVAIKENLETGSYGCLFWIKEGDFTAITTAEEFLTDHQKSDLAYIKKFRVTEQGAAVALNRTDDDFTNVNNLKRFIFDFTANLSLNFYKNCCCECGRTDDLAIYSADGVIAQACSECGVKYQLLMIPGSGNAAQPISAANHGKEEKAVESADKTETTLSEAAAEQESLPVLSETNDKTEDVSEFILNEADIEAVKAEEVSEFTEIKSDNADVSEFILTEADIEAAKAENITPVLAEVKSEAADVSEFMLTEADIEAAKAENTAPVLTEIKNESTDVSEFMLTEEDIAAAEAEEKNITSAPEEIAENFDSLLYDKEEIKEPERPRSKLFEEAEREFAEEQARLAEEAANNPPENVLNELLINDNGEIAIKEIEPEADDGSADITEIRDDSNDGEDIEIEEIESTVTQPTITTGHPQLTAEETPLEKDGSVPLINPNSHREERHVSPVDGPDAVQPLELAQTITNEMLSVEEPKRELPPGYSDGANMSRDEVPQQKPPAYENYTVGYSSYAISDFTNRSNAFMGIIGALVIGLIGAAVWVLIADKLGVISYWGSLAIVASVFGGYRLAGRSMDKKGIVISFIIVLLMAAACVFVISALEVTKELEEVLSTDVSFFEGAEWFLETIKNGSNSSIFVKNIAITTVITMIANLVCSVRLWKNA